MNEISDQATAFAFACASLGYLWRDLHYQGLCYHSYQKLEWDAVQTKGLSLICGSPVPATDWTAFNSVHIRTCRGGDVILPFSYSSVAAFSEKKEAIVGPLKLNGNNSEDGS